MTTPQPRTYPFTNSISGGDVTSIRGVTEHYFPMEYKDFRCSVKSFNTEIKNFIQMEINTVFKIYESKDLMKSLYKDEDWKMRRTKHLLERYPEKAKKMIFPVPFFSLMLNKGLQVTEASLLSDGCVIDMVYDMDSDMLVMPTSFPPLADMSDKDKYIYYDKKSVVFYSDIQIGAEYELSIILEANASFEFAPLFPFGMVHFEKILTYSSGELKIVPNALEVQPYSGRLFPEWFQYQLDRLESREQTKPRFRPALPYRGTFPLFEVINESDNSLKYKVIDLSKPFDLSSYNTVRFAIAVIIPPDKNIDVIVRTIKRPIAPRVYEQIQKLPNFRDVLVEYNIFNLSNNILHLWIETEIPGYSEKEKKYIIIHGLNTKTLEKPRAVITQCPRLKKGILDQLITPVKATMLCKITNKTNGEVLYEETFNIDILSNDEMIWELDDLRSNQKYNLRAFICAWITPKDRDGLLDKVRSGARKYHPDNTLGHKTRTFEDIKLHVKALYNYLANEGVHYLNQPFSSLRSSNSQRVVYPEKVLENKAGNCIDLVVLFASLLEAFGIYSLIVLTPSHAFMGWGNKKNKDEMIFLETTVIGRNDFETAMALGKKAFEDNFLMDYKATPLYIPDLRMMNGCYIIDMQKARYSDKIFSRT